MKKNVSITRYFTMYRFLPVKLISMVAILGIFLCTSCARSYQQGAKYNYDDLKKSILKGGFDKLTPDQQAFVKQELIEKLKSDSDFVQYNALHDDFKLDALNSVPVAGQTTSTPKAPHTDDEWLAFFQAKGFKDPQGALTTMKKMNVEEQAYERKYPEMLSIGSAASLEVYNAARKHRMLKFTPNQ